MNILLLSGGSGKRLWPLSNDIRSKQFIKMFKTDGGVYESMVQRVYRQIMTENANARVIVATSKSQVSVINNQLGGNVGISVEPCRRDTFPAIALAASYMTDVMKIKPSESVIVCPVDPYVNADYFTTLSEMYKLSENGIADLVLMGIEPDSPSEKFGYMIPEDSERVSAICEFKEKPDRRTAEKYIADGGLWNGGVFAFKLEYVLKRAHELIDFENYLDLYEKYDKLPRISFDYAVVEHEKNIKAVRFSGMWRDLGTWNSFTEAMTEDVIGDGIIGDTCEGVNIVNEMNIPVLAVGLRDTVISVSPEGILVADKSSADGIKPYVDKIARRIMFAEKSWGSFQVLEAEEESLTIKVTLNPGHCMNYHSHRHRDEVWTVIYGNGRACIDGNVKKISVGDVIEMPSGCRHTVFADTELRIIEVQTGREINVSDKEKHPMPACL